MGGGRLRVLVHLRDVGQVGEQVGPEAGALCEPRAQREQLSWSATHDPLTQLGNRALLQDRLLQLGDLGVALGQQLTKGAWVVGPGDWRPSMNWLDVIELLDANTGFTVKVKLIMESQPACV